MLASKLHLGWNTLLEHDWGHPLPYPEPDIQGMSWRDLLPDRVYALNSNSPLPEPTDLRPCPNCYWGDFKSVRQLANGKLPEERICPQDSGSSCGLERLAPLTPDE